MTKAMSYFFIFSFIIRVLVVLIIANYGNAFYSDFGDVATNILNGDGYSISPGYYWQSHLQPTAMQMPLYTYFTACFYWMFGVQTNTAHLAMQLVQCLISAATIIPLLKILKMNDNKSVYSVFGVIYCLYPPSLLMTLKLSSTTFIMFFIAWALYLTLDLYKKSLAKTFTLLGFVWGFTFLTVPVFAPYAVLSFLPLLWKAYKENELTKIFAQVVKTAVLSLVVLSPWVIRNYQTFNQFIPFTTSLGSTCFIGNNLYATGEQLHKFIPYKNMLKDKEIIERYPQLKTMPNLENEYFVSKAYMDIVKDFVNKYPLKALKLFVNKFRFYWSYSPNHHSMNKLSGKIYAFLFFMVFLSFFYGAYKIIKDKSAPDRMLLYQVFALSITTSLIYSITSIGAVRFRVQIEHLLLMVAVIGVLKMKFLKSCLNIFVKDSVVDNK